jgi:hypothetical protein
MVTSVLPAFLPAAATNRMPLLLWRLMASSRDCNRVVQITAALLWLALDFVMLAAGQRNWHTAAPDAASRSNTQ